jgi:Spy/CpxP family protein refolding chaperone
MRHVGIQFLAAAALCLLASPAFSQRGQRQPGGFGPQEVGLSQLLTNEGVQKELKITKDQAEKFTKAAQEQRTKMREAFQDAGGDMDKLREIMTKFRAESEKAAAKLASDTLKPEQVKRLKQMALQANGLRSFTKPEVQKELKLTETQIKDVTKISADVQKEAGELLRDAGRDRDKRQEAQKKIATLNTEALAKVAKSLTADQQKTWTAMIGDKFTYVPTPFRRPNN